MRDLFFPRVKAENLEHAPKRRGQFEQVPEYIRYSGFDRGDLWGRADSDLAVERRPTVRR